MTRAHLDGDVEARGGSWPLGGKWQLVLKPFVDKKSISDRQGTIVTRDPRDATASDLQQARGGVPRGRGEGLAPGRPAETV